jgi:xylan 1,4-beta-xylosidase
MTDSTPNLAGRRTVLGAAVTALGASLVSAAPAYAEATGPRALVDLDGPKTDFPHLWEKVIAGDWARQVLRADYQEQLFQTRDDLGIQSLRFHGIFTDSISTFTPT